MSVIPLRINFDGPTAERMAISQCAKFIRRRIADTQAAEAWIACGERLASLKLDLGKTQPRGDNEHIGWRQAFELQPREFPFSRRHADRLIQLYNFFAGHACPMKKLPASYRALNALIKNGFEISDITRCVESGEISPGSTDSEINDLAVKLRLKSKPRKNDPKSLPKKKRIAKVMAVMKKLAITLEDLKNG